MFRRLSLRKQFHIVTFSLFVGCLLLGILIIYPTLKNMFDTSTHIREIQQELEAEYTETQTMRRTLRELEEVSNEIVAYEGSAISVESELAMIEEMEALAARHGLDQTLDATYMPTPDPAVGLPSYTFTLVLHGTLTQLFAYLQTLEAQPYYVLLNGVELQKTGTAEGSLRLTARIFTTPTSH